MEIAGSTALHLLFMAHHYWHNLCSSKYGVNNVLENTQPCAQSVWDRDWLREITLPRKEKLEQGEPRFINLEIFHL